MNIIICGFSFPENKALVRWLSEEYGMERTFLISNINHLDGQNHAVYYDYNDIVYGDYVKNRVDSTVVIDSALLEKMSFAEAMYYRMMDRTEIKKGQKISYRERQGLYYRDLAMVKGILNNSGAKLCIFDSIPHMGFDYLLYELCKIYKIKVVMFSICVPMLNISACGFLLSDIRNPLPNIKKEMDRIDEEENVIVLSERMQNYFDYYRRKKGIVSLVSFNVLEKQNIFIKYLKSTVKFIINKDRRLIPAIKLRTIGEIKYIRVKRCLKKTALKTLSDDEYIYFPLHYQPEMTSLPMGFYYSDQLLVIEMLAKLLPENIKLYVKPHPRMSLVANAEYYKRIKEIRGVKILSRSINTYDVIDHALAIVTLTGTAGWEGLLRGKPVLLFGYCFYQYARGVYRINTADDLKNAIEELFIKKKYEYKERYIKIFLSALDKYLIDGYTDMGWCKVFRYPEKEMLECLQKGYRNFLNKN